MTKKRLRIPLLLLAAAMVMSLVAPTVAFAEETLPTGFTGMDSVNLEVDSGYAWHEMTDVEAAKYGLTAYTGTNVYIAGNCGREDGVYLDEAVSNLAITVTEPGSLTFEYALSTPSGQGGLFYLGYCVNTQVELNAYSMNCDWSMKGDVIPGTDGWAACTVSIDETAFVDGAPAVIYIAYQHGAYWDFETYTDLNYAAIRNVTYSTGGREDVVKGYDTAMGTVTAQLVTTTTDDAGKTSETLTNADPSDLDIGSTYRLTATANSGYQFYGWVKHSGESAEYQTLSDGKLDVTVDTATYYTPIFAATGTYVLRNGATFYDGTTTTLKAAIEGAKSGDVLVLLKDATVSEDINVPEGVTLYLPFRNEWEKEEAGYYDSYGNFYLKYHLSINTYGTRPIVGDEKTYVRLTVDSGSTLTVNGDLVIGAIVGQAAQGIQNHVSGDHGRITNNGTIELNNGGSLKCYGVVDGSGTVYANDGAQVKESFVIGDYAGGSNSSELFDAKQMPFKRFAMQNVQCKLQMESGSNLVAMMNIWALEAFNEAEVVLMGSSSEAAFQTDSTKTNTLVLTRTYNANKAIANQGECELGGATGIGRTEWTFSSGLTFNPFTIAMGGMKLDTRNCDFVVPYNFKLNLVEGVYNIPLGLRLMPGAEMYVASGASLNVSGRLMVMDGLVQSNILNQAGAGCLYPTRAMLTDAGFSGSGELTVDGTLKMLSGSSLGGLIKSNGGGTVSIEDGVYVNNSGTLASLDQTKDLYNQQYDWVTSEGGVYNTSAKKIYNWVQQDGAKGYYDENTTWYNLPARIYTAEGIVKAEAGKTYTSTACAAATDSYDVDYLYVADDVYGYNESTASWGYLTTSNMRVMTSASETVSHTLYAVWADGSEEVKVTETTVAGLEGVKVTCSTEKSGNDTVLSNLQVVDKTTGEAKTEKYVFLVKYTIEGSTTGTTVTANDDGSYNIPPEANGVTIESCMLGDISGDGEIKIADVRNAFKAVNNSTYAAGLSELQLLAADFDQSGALKIADVRKIYNYALSA